MTGQSATNVASRPRGAAYSSTASTRPLGRDLFALTRPSVVLSNMLLVATGLALAPAASSMVVLAALVGTALLIGACSALNMIFESDVDARLPGESSRPVAAGRVSSAAAATFGVMLFLLGAFMLAEYTTLLAAALGIAACIIYVGIYTPLKQRSLAAVPVGAFAGALLPMIGWFAVGGEPTAAALMLFAAVFVWQIPHFMAIGLRRWKDYREAGLRIGADPSDLHASVTSIRLATLLLQVVTLGVVFTAGGAAFTVLVAIAAVFMLLTAFRPSPDPVLWARRVFLASLVYVPALAVGALLPF